VCAAIDLDTKLILDARPFGRHGTDPAAAFLHGLRGKHDLSEAVFFVDQFGYRTAFARLGLNGRVDYTDRNLIEKWFHTLKMRVDRFHNSWVGSRASARKWIEQFVHDHNHQRPHQSLNGRTPAEEVLNWTVPVLGIFRFVWINRCYLAVRVEAGHISSRLITSCSSSSMSELICCCVNA
jgi:putative transposase